MPDDQRPEGATNARPKHETIAESGPGLPDEARGPGEGDDPLPDSLDRDLAVQGLEEDEDDDLDVEEDDEDGDLDDAEDED